MVAVVLILGLILGIVLACLSVFEIRRDNLDSFAFLWFIFILSMVFGMAIERASEVSVSDYLKSPENYQVDTFMINGVVDHYKVYNK